jgi:hypothetical protein
MDVAIPIKPKHVRPNKRVPSERKPQIQASMKWKPYKNRAIQRARDAKQYDGRGEEAEVDMSVENTSSMISSREARKFTITHSRNIYTYHRAGHYAIEERVRVVNDTVVKGTIYKHPTSPDMTIIHELGGESCRLILNQPFLYTERQLYDIVENGPGEYKTEM